MYSYFTPMNGRCDSVGYTGAIRLRQTQHLRSQCPDQPQDNESSYQHYIFSYAKKMPEYKTSSDGILGQENHQNHDLHFQAGDEATQMSLCDVCREIDFSYSCSSFCGSCVGVSTSTVLRHVGEHLCLGSLNRLEQNQACSGCHLILSCVKAYYHQGLPAGASKVHLRRAENGFTTPKASVSGGTSRRVLPATILQVTICTHGLQGGSTAPDDEIVGVIAPVPEKKASMAVPARDSKLFATPRPSHECGLEPREISDFANASLMKSWLQHCKRQHDHDCGNRLSTATPQAMIRLIDTKELKLVKGNLHMEFVALSYV